MLDADGHREIDVGHDALVQEQIVDGQPLLGTAHGAIGDGFDAVAALGAQLGDVHHQAAELRRIEGANALGLPCAVIAHEGAEPPGR